jgi:hypothetical protein
MAEPLCPCELVIPLDYNPEHAGLLPDPVEPEVMAGILTAVAERLGPFSTLGWSGVGDIPPGVWEGYSDRSVRIEVSLPQERTPEFVEMVRLIGIRLKQKAMYYKIGPPSAHIMVIGEE